MPVTSSSSSSSSQSALTRMIAGVVAAALARHAQALDELASELPASMGVAPSPEIDSLARELLRAYVADRGLVEATKLIDVDGDPEHAIEPFRDSLVFSLALAVAARLLDASDVRPDRPIDARPDALLDLLERAYALVRGYV